MGESPEGNAWLYARLSIVDIGEYRRRYINDVNARVTQRMIDEGLIGANYNEP